MKGVSHSVQHWKGNRTFLAYLPVQQYHKFTHSRLNDLCTKSLEPNGCIANVGQTSHWSAMRWPDYGNFRSNNNHKTQALSSFYDHCRSWWVRPYGVTTDKSAIFLWAPLYRTLPSFRHKMKMPITHTHETSLKLCRACNFIGQN